MRTLLRFLKPYRLQTAIVLAALAVNLAGVLLVPTILANMINIGISTGDFDYIVTQGMYGRIRVQLFLRRSVYESWTRHPKRGLRCLARLLGR